VGDSRGGYGGTAVVETTVVVETEEDINIFSSYKKKVSMKIDTFFYFGYNKQSPTSLVL
jgi:hypothetical protein